MTAPALLTAAYLRAQGYCPDGCDRFEKRYPDGVHLTAEWLRDHDSLGLLGRVLVPPATDVAAHRAYLAAHRACADALRACDAAYPGTCAAAYRTYLAAHRTYVDAYWACKDEPEFWVWLAGSTLAEVPR